MQVLDGAVGEAAEAFGLVAGQVRLAAPVARSHLPPYRCPRLAGRPPRPAPQTVGPTAPAHPAKKPWTNLEKQEDVQVIKARSGHLRQPLGADMANDEITVSADSIHILKHHGSYMQQNRDLKKKAEREQSYQFMLRLKVPVGEVPPQVFRCLDDLSNTHGQGDLRATTRQAFQLHGVLKGASAPRCSRAPPHPPTPPTLTPPPPSPHPHPSSLSHPLTHPPPPATAPVHPQRRPGPPPRGSQAASST